MTYRVRNISVAVALALVAAMLTLFYVTSYQRNVQREEANVKVFVATKDMDDPSQVTGAQIRDAMFELNTDGGEEIGIGPAEFAKATKHSPATA